jgi:TPR repeat protein
MDFHKTIDSPDFIKLPLTDIIPVYHSLSDNVRRLGLLTLDSIPASKSDLFFNKCIKWIIEGEYPDSMYHQAIEEINKTNNLQIKDTVRMYFHLLACLLLQNGEWSISHKLTEFAKRFEKQDPDSKNIVKDILKYIKIADGRIFNKKEAQILTILGSGIKNYNLAEKMLSELDTDNMYGVSLYNMAILNYLKYNSRPDSMNTALDYSIRASDMGNYEAAFTVGHQLLFGVPAFCNKLNGLLNYPDEKTAVLGFSPYPGDVKTIIKTDKALIFLNKAADGGIVNAFDVLAKYYAENGEPKKAINLLDRSIDYLSGFASEVLGDYYSGRVEFSHHTFLKYFPQISYKNKNGLSRNEIIEELSRDAINNFYGLDIENNRSLIPKLLDTIFKSSNPIIYINTLKKIYGLKTEGPWGLEYLKNFITSEDGGEINSNDFLGICYFGPILKRDLNKAFSYLLDAYIHGRKTGYTVFLLGILYLSKANGFPDNPVKAHILFMEAADLGFVPAAAIAGKSCYDGGRAFFPAELEVSENEKNSEKKFIAAIPSLFNDPKSDQDLNLQNTLQAEKYLCQAADAGIAYCGEKLETHYTLRNDFNRAYEYISKASRYGSEEASLKMAGIYTGVSDIKNSTAYSSIAKAAKIKRNYKDALFYCELANIQGKRKNYHMRLIEIIENKSQDIKNLEFINNLLEISVENGIKAAAVKLGFNFIEGKTCTKNEIKGIDLLTCFNDNIQPIKKDCIFDTKENLEFSPGIKRANYLVSVYGNTDHPLFDKSLSNSYIKHKNDLEAQKEEGERMLAELFG